MPWLDEYGQMATKKKNQQGFGQSFMNTALPASDSAALATYLTQPPPAPNLGAQNVGSQTTNPEMPNMPPPGGTHPGGGDKMPTLDQAQWYWEDLNRFADARGETNNWVDQYKDQLIAAFQLNPNWYEAPGVYDTFLDVPHAPELYETMASYFGGPANYGMTDAGRQYTNYIPGWDTVGTGRRA